MCCHLFILLQCAVISYCCCQSCHVGNGNRPTYRQCNLLSCLGTAKKYGRWVFSKQTPELGPWVEKWMMGSPEEIHFHIRVLEVNGRWVPPRRHTLRARRSIIKTLAGVPNHFRISSQIGSQIFPLWRSSRYLTLSTNISPYPQDRRQIWAVPL